MSKYDKELFYDMVSDSVWELGQQGLIPEDICHKNREFLSKMLLDPYIPTLCDLRKQAMHDIQTSASTLGIPLTEQQSHTLAGAILAALCFSVDSISEEQEEQQ